jgi:hypothetical protein
MTAKLTFDNVEFVQNSEQTVRVRQGQGFDLAMEDVGDPSAYEFATKRDPVLTVTDNESISQLGARVVADKPGKSEIQVQDAGRQVVFWLGIEVYNDDAVSLGITSKVESLN